ncbi:hypothetical protein ACWDWT_15700, partial [Streptomyces sp. NPDC003343]
AQNRMWLAEVLAAAEDAAPVASLDVVARSLRAPASPVTFWAAPSTFWARTGGARPSSWHGR